MTKQPITRANIDSMLDVGQLYIQMSSGRWWRLRRNGATKRWVKSPDRIRVPVKYGFRNCGALDESHFYGQYMDPSNVRHVDDVPASVRSS